MGYAIEYLFGDSFLIAPITSAIRKNGTAKHEDGIWLPPGKWFLGFTD